MSEKTKKEKIVELIENMSAADMVQVNNEWCNNAGYPDNWIYSMDEFDEICAGMTPWEVARAAYYSGKFCPAHDWFWFNGYGNLESDDFPIGQVWADDIADYCIDNDADLYNDEIREILDEEEEEREED